MHNRKWIRNAGIPVYHSSFPNHKFTVCSHRIITPDIRGIFRKWVNDIGVNRNSEAFQVPSWREQQCLFHVEISSPGLVIILRTFSRSFSIRISNCHSEIETRESGCNHLQSRFRVGKRSARCRRGFSLFHSKNEGFSQSLLTICACALLIVMQSSSRKKQERMRIR